MQLSIVVAPEDIRLQPTSQDGYTWNRLPEREHSLHKTTGQARIGAAETSLHDARSTLDRVQADKTD